MKKKGFIVVDMERCKTYLVVDKTQVAKLLGVNARTIYKWFKTRDVYIERKWLIANGYELVRSERGAKEFKRGNDGDDLIGK